jgi:hypothetical protein
MPNYETKSVANINDKMYYLEDDSQFFWSTFDALNIFDTLVTPSSNNMTNNILKRSKYKNNNI